MNAYCNILLTKRNNNKKRQNLKISDEQVENDVKKHNKNYGTHILLYVRLKEDMVLFLVKVSFHLQLVEYKTTGK